MTNMNLLYLGGKGLALLDFTYLGRFWTSYEVVLLLRKIQNGRIAPFANHAEVDKRATLIEYGAAEGSNGLVTKAFRETWGSLSIPDAVTKLAKDDVTVTTATTRPRCYRYCRSTTAFSAYGLLAAAALRFARRRQRLVTAVENSNRALKAVVEQDLC
ncbi:unnamed protein product [Effrenium voratum]|nr:unnamed protein product [Effrenium voratum]